MPRIQLLHPGYAREEIGQVEFTGRRGTLVEYTDTNRYEIVDGGVTDPTGACRYLSEHWVGEQNSSWSDKPPNSIDQPWYSSMAASSALEGRQRPCQQGERDPVKVHTFDTFEIEDSTTVEVQCVIQVR